MLLQFIKHLFQDISSNCLNQPPAAWSHHHVKWITVTILTYYYYMHGGDPYQHVNDHYSVQGWEKTYYIVWNLWDGHWASTAIISPSVMLTYYTRAQNKQQIMIALWHSIYKAGRGICETFFGSWTSHPHDLLISAPKLLLFVCSLPDFFVCNNITCQVIK